jgi:hypothetical protein
VHSLRFKDFDNSDLKDFSKRNSCLPPGIVLSWFFDFCKVPSTLSRLSDLCMPCTRYLHKVWILVDDCACLATVSLHPFQRESFVLSLLSFRTETNSINALLAFYVHTLHHSTEEKQLKLILTFIVPSIHNEIHSFIHERIIIENCKTMSTTCIGSIFPLLYSKRKWLQLK